MVANSNPTAVGTAHGCEDLQQKLEACYKENKELREELRKEATASRDARKEAREWSKEYFALAIKCAPHVGGASSGAYK